MRTCSLIAAVLTSIVAAGGAGAQAAPSRQGGITGRVTDQSTGLPVPSAAVVVTGTSLGAITNDSGVYSIRAVPVGTHQLRASRVGYGPGVRTVSVSAGSVTTADLTIGHVPFVLEEVVTTATGEQRTRELGNSIPKIDVPSIASAMPITNMQDLLNSRAAGVTLIQQSGVVGSGSRIRIRGLSSASLSNDPLVYVDGIKVETGSPVLSVFVGGGHPSFLNDIDPDEIESIEIVKGPSASTLYGTQAANGVIRITTKRAKAGRTQWSFFDEEGQSKDISDYPGQYYSQGTSTTGAVRQCLPWQQVAGQCTITQLYSRNLFRDPISTPLTTGYRGARGLQISGGPEQVHYFLSGGLDHEYGNLRMPQMEQDFLKSERGVTVLPREQLGPNELQRVNLRGNLGALLSNNVDVTLSSGYESSDNRIPQTGDNTQGILGAALFGTANPAKASNPWGFARPAEGFSDVVYRRDTRFINSLQSNWRPLSFITARGTVGLDYLNYSDEANNAAGQGCKICGLNRQGLRTINRWTSAKYTVDFGATATRQLTSRIESKTSVGAQWIRDRFDGTLNTANVFPPGITRIDAGAIKTSGEQTLESRTLGQYVEQQFGLDQRLYLTGAIRYDQNSAFGKNNRSAVYPKISGSWVALEKGHGGGRYISWLDELRFRSAFGVSGQQPGPLDALRYLSPITSSLLGSDQPAVTLAGLGNESLKPERSQEFEGGFDAGFIDSRVNLQATYYNKRTTDALINRVLPGSLGATVSRIENIGVVTNRGVEVSLNGRLLDLRRVTFDVNLEASRNTNKLVDLGGLPPITGFGYQNRVGYPLFGLWWPQMQSYNDANKNGIIEPSEVKVSDSTLFGGSSVPTRTLSISPTLTVFTRLTFSGLVDRRAGYVNLNANEWFQCVPTQNCRAINDPTAPLIDQARAIAGGNGIGAYLEDASFWKLRELSVSYSIPEQYITRGGVRSATILLTARNLGTWSKFGSWDPEIATQGNDAAVYNFVQPAPTRIWTLRLNLGF